MTFLYTETGENNRLALLGVRVIRRSVCLFFLISFLTNSASVYIFKFEAVAPTVSDEYERNAALQAETDALLPLFDNMPPVPVYLSDKAILKSGSNVERGLAYTNCENKEFPTIIVKKSFYETNNRKWIVNVLKHELTHAWLCRRRAMSGHDARFREKFTQIGGFGN